MQVGVPTPGALEPPAKGRHRLTLAAGEAAFLEVAQEDFDLAVEILDPDGESILVFDGPYGTGAAEHVCFVAAKDGDHQVRISAFGERGGDYTIRVESIRPATPEDRLCFDASRRFMDAEAERFEKRPSPKLAKTFDEIHRSWVDARQPFLAAVALRQAGALWKTLRDGEEARRCFAGALALAVASHSPYLEIRLRLDLGQLLAGRHEVEEARAEFELALDRARAEGLKALEATARSHLAWIDRHRGEIHRAIEQDRAALEVGGEALPDRERAQIQVQLAESYSLLDHHDEALRLTKSALETLRELAGEPAREIKALTTIGWLHYLMGEPEAGLPFIERALALARATGDQEAEIGVLDRLGTLRRGGRNFEGAFEAYRDSLRLSSNSGDVRAVTHTSINLGCLYQEWQRPRDALARLEQARPEARKAGDWDALSYLEYCQARTLRDLGRVDEALAHVASAEQLVAELRNIARSHGNRFGPVWLWQDFAELHFELLMEKARQTGDRSSEVAAFEMIDLARSQRLFELVLEGQIGVRSAAPDPLLDQERAIRRELGNLAESRLDGGAAAQDGPEAVVLERQIDELMIELEQVRSAIRTSDPRYRELVAPRRISLGELRRQLEPGAYLLRYLLGRDASYLFVVGRDHWDVLNLEKRETLEPKILSVYLALRRTRNPDLQARLTADVLGQQLLPLDCLPEGARRLLIVPDGALHYLPFPVLPSPLRDGSPNEAGTNRILDDFEVQSLPSAALLVALHRANPNSDSGVPSAAVFGDPVFSDADDRLGTAPPSSCGSELRSISIERLPSGDLPRLPCTRREGQFLLDRIDDDHELAAFDFQANLQTLRGADLTRYRLLHFATHAFVDEEFPELSGLVLSRRDRRGQPIDGNLYLHEVYDLDLDAELVTLSGCQTALGRQVRGDGLLSMSRGFFYAGARRVLVSLWSVDDEATSELMARFYEALLDRHEPPIRALRSAQLWMRDHPRWSAPYYWAGFVLQGSP